MNIDIIRIIALTFIVMLHTLNRQYGLDIWMAGYSVISIGVNLFIMISGYLLLDKVETTKDFFKKRLMGIIPLFIAFNIIYILMYKFSLIKNNGKSLSAPHFWYIYMILGLYLLTPWLRKVLKYAEKETFFVIILWFLYNILNPYLNFFHLKGIPASNFPIVGFFGYYLIGYYLKKYKEKVSKIPIFYTFGIYFFGFFISFFSTKYILNTTGKQISNFFDKNSLGTFFMTISFFVFWLKFKFKERKKSIKTISDATYFAYLVHLIVLDYVIRISDEMIFKSIATIVISLLSGIIYNNIKILLHKKH